MDWIRKQLETTLGKTATGLIMFFIIGVASALYLPEIVLTKAVFSYEKQQIYASIRLNELELIQMDKRNLIRQILDLEYQIEKQGGAATYGQKARMDRLIKELNDLEEREKALREERKKNQL